MKPYPLLSLSLIAFLSTTLSVNLQADTTTFYEQLTAKKTIKQKTRKIAPNKGSAKQKAIQKLPPKPRLLPKAGTTNVQLQYSMVETTGTQLSVDGFSLLPVFVAGNIESQDIVRTGHRLDVSIGRSLTSDSQLIMNIPYRRESEELTNDEGQTTTQTRKSNHGLGDISLTYASQIFKNNHQLPSILGIVTWKTPTGKDAYESDNTLGLGTGFHSIRTGIRATKQDDPAFLFANMGYTWNIKDKKKNIGTINSGNIYDLSFGTAYSLTDSLNMNVALEQTWTMKTTINDKDVVNSDRHTAALSIGGILKLSPKKPISVRAKIGLNEATPGFQLQLAMPLK